MQILELQKHRNFIEQTVAQQSTIVYQLEEKLRSTEDLIRHSAAENKNSRKEAQMDNLRSSAKHIPGRSSVPDYDDTESPSESPVYRKSTEESSRRSKSSSPQVNKKLKSSASPPLLSKSSHGHKQGGRHSNRYNKDNFTSSESQRNDLWDNMPDSESNVDIMNSDVDPRASAAVVSILRDVLKDLITRESKESSKRKVIYSFIIASITD